MKNSFTENKILKGVIWSFIGTVVSKSFLFIAIFILARIIPVIEFGKISIIQSYIGTFTLISLASFGVTTTKYLALYARKDNEKASEILSLTSVFVYVIGLIILCLSLIFNIELTEYLSGNSDLYNEIFVSSIAVLFASINGLQIGALAGLEKFKQIAIVNIINGLFVLPLICILGLFYGAIGVAISFAVSNFITFLLSSFYIRKAKIEHKLFFTLKKLKQHLGSIYHFSIPSFLSSMMISPIVLYCNATLAQNKNGFYELGIYNAMYNFAQLGLIFIGITGQVLYPYAMQNYSKGNKKFDFINIHQSYIIGLLLFVPMLILPDIFCYIYGSKYDNQGSYITLTIIALFAIIVSQRQGIARNFAAGDLMWFSVVSNFSWAVFAVISMQYLVEYGAKGRALSFLIAYLLNTIIFIPFYIHKGLINKFLILTKEHLLLIALIIASLMTSFYINDLILRIVLLLIFLVIIGITFKLWYKKYSSLNIQAK